MVALQDVAAENSGVAGRVPFMAPSTPEAVANDAAYGALNDINQTDGAMNGTQSKPPISARKLAANRANAQKSTGPRTEAGKAKARLNALNHGVFSACVVLPGEPKDDLAVIAEDLRPEYMAASAVERTLIRRMLAVEWKLHRLARAEEEMIISPRLAALARRRIRANDPNDDVTDEDLAGVSPNDCEALAADFGQKDGTGKFQRLMNAEIRLTGQLTTVCRLLLKAREEGAGKDGTRERNRRVDLMRDMLEEDDELAMDAEDEAEDEDDERDEHDERETVEGTSATPVSEVPRRPGSSCDDAPLDPGLRGTSEPGVADTPSTEAAPLRNEPTVEIETPNTELRNEPTEKSAAEASDLRNEATKQRHDGASDLRNEATQTSGLAGATGAAKKMDPDARLKELYRQLSEFGKQQFEDFD